MAEIQLLQQVLVALALGVLVGLERERAAGRKYAGVRTLSLFCAGGPLAVLIADSAGAVAPVGIYLALGALFSLLIVYVRMELAEGDLGLTTSSTVFLMALVGVLIGYEYQFEAVSVTLLAVFLLAEKQAFKKYTQMLDADEISDAVKLGILALVLYPILPEGAIDPYGVIFLREALLFVIFILLIQFAAFASLKYFQSDISFILSTALGGVVSSLAVVSTMIQYVKEKGLEETAYVASVSSTAAMVVRNAVIAAVLAPALIPELVAPFGTAAVIGLIFVLLYYRHVDGTKALDFGADSPFSFRSAFKFGIIYLGILLLAEIAGTQFATAGIYATAFIGGIGSSTAVVASAATLMNAADPITTAQAATMVALGAVSSLLTKLVYAELNGAHKLVRHVILPYLFMCLALLSTLL